MSSARPPADSLSGAADAPTFTPAFSCLPINPKLRTLSFWLWWWGSLDIKPGLLQGAVELRLCCRLLWSLFFLPNSQRTKPGWSVCRHGSSRGRLRVEEKHREHPRGVWLHGGARIVSTLYSVWDTVAHWENWRSHQVWLSDVSRLNINDYLVPSEEDPKSSKCHLPCPES